jgi:hypothetical protein
MPRDDKKIEELLAILDQETDTISKDGTDAFTFLEFYNIKSGKHKVKRKALYKLYKQWSHEPIKSIEFTTKLSLYLDGDDYRWFINKDPLKQIIPLIKPKKSNPKSYRNTYLFFTEMGWKKGPYFYPASTLFYMASEWAKKNRKVPPGQQAFYVMLTMTFPRKIIDAFNREYGINKELNISRQKMVAIREKHVNKKRKK